MNRSSLYYKPKPISEDEIFLLYRTAEIFANYPFYGYRRIYEDLIEEGFDVGKEKTMKNIGNSMKIKSLILAGIFGTALASQGSVVVEETFGG